MMQSQEIIDHVYQLARPARREQDYTLFRAYPGGYGEGDEFMGGVKVPELRKLGGRLYKQVDLYLVTKLLQNKYHEVRMLAIILLLKKFKSKKCDKACKWEIIKVYENNIHYVNNWDLVDMSAPHLTGEWYFDRERKKLFAWLKSRDLWLQRIAVLSTFYFIKQGDFTDTFKMAGYLLDHKHDLIHKAVGWMLREIGKRDKALLVDFLDKEYTRMPRTMLRYATEKFTPAERKSYSLRKTIDD